MNKSTQSDSKQPITYADAGVNIDAGNHLVSLIKPMVKKTYGPEVLGGVGGFAACFQPDLTGIKEPVLVSSTDGVGTKLKLAQALNQHQTIGIDLVAMCVNDLICCGARPLFFLDYFACNKLSPELAATVVAGITEGCIQSGMALVGGETAEMPGLYHDEDYDLAGFSVGMVDKSKQIDGSAVRTGDAIIALASSGAHSNGYSLIRKLLFNQTSGNETITALTAERQTLAKQLMTPTRIYVKTVLALLKTYSLNAIAHITGGGLLENVIRVVPAELQVNIDCSSWQLPPLFQWLANEARLNFNELHRTFNCGVGLVIVVPQAVATDVIATATSLGETAWQIGTITSRADNEDAIVFHHQTQHIAHQE